MPGRESTFRHENGIQIGLVLIRAGNQMEIALFFHAHEKAVVAMFIDDLEAAHFAYRITQGDIERVFIPVRLLV